MISNLTHGFPKVLSARENGALFSAWLLALVSTLAVLFVGEILGQEPCVLCWYQRAFMFPLAIILGVAVWYSDGSVWRYGVPLAIGGAGVALFHSLLYFGIVPQTIQPCSASGPSCTDQEMAIFGLPIPVLALLAFIAIIILLLQLRQGRQS